MTMSSNQRLSPSQTDPARTELLERIIDTALCERLISETSARMRRPSNVRMVQHSRRSVPLRSDRTGPYCGLVGLGLGIMGGAFVAYTTSSHSPNEEFVMAYTAAALVGAVVGFFGIGSLFECAARGFRAYQGWRMHTSIRRSNNNY